MELDDDNNTEGANTQPIIVHQQPPHQEDKDKEQDPSPSPSPSPPPSPSLPPEQNPDQSMTMTPVTSLPLDDNMLIDDKDALTSTSTTTTTTTATTTNYNEHPATADVDEMETDDNDVPAAVDHNVVNVDVVVVVAAAAASIDVKLQTDGTPPSVDTHIQHPPSPSPSPPPSPNHNVTKLHSDNSQSPNDDAAHQLIHPSVDVNCHSNGFDDPNLQPQSPAHVLPIDNALVQIASADDPNLDATTDGVHHGDSETGRSNQLISGTPPDTTTETKSKDHNTTGTPDKDAESKLELVAINDEQVLAPKLDTKSSGQSFLLDPHAGVGHESGTEEEQASFMKELETFHKERSLDFKPPKFYGEGLNLLKLWRAVIRLGGYEQVTSCKLWRQVGESFKPPKTCTTVSWTFRCFYEKALLEYEKHEMHSGELSPPDASLAAPSSIGNQAVGSQGLGSGRARRDAAARAMQGWHSQRLVGNGEDKNSISTLKREKQLKSIGLLKRKTTSPVERAVKVARMKAIRPQVDTMVVDAGPPADWVKINVRRTKDCFEVYALVPGLLREEVRVQSDPVGRLVISGEPEQLDNPWGVTPFKKVVSLPSRIDPHQTSAVVTLHGQLFVRVPFEQSDL